VLPASHQIGGNVRILLEEEQHCRLKGGVAEKEKIEHHQHADGAISYGEGPVTTGNNQIVTQIYVYY
jgi:peptidoglycan hydrolase-like amidase